MPEIWDADWIIGNFGERKLSDRPAEQSASEVQVRMGQYPAWKQMFTGEYLRQEIADAPYDPASNEPVYKWPSRVNLFKSYGLLHASTLWGRGETGREADNLFDVEIDEKIPGIGGPELVSAAPLFREELEYWWSFNQDKLRPSAGAQMWAGGCILKVSWMPAHPEAVYGCILEVIDPEYFWPVYDPLNYDTLIAARMKFSVDELVAQYRYGLDPSQIKLISKGGKVPVREEWTRESYAIVLGEGNNEKVARVPNVAGGAGTPYAGKNPWRHPITNIGLIPVWYTPRIRPGTGYFGDSLCYDLEGPVTEMNKALSDIGDALNDSSHLQGVIADMHSLSSRFDEDTSIEIPRGKYLNLGLTPQGASPGKFYPVPTGTIPPATPQYLDKLTESADATALLTPASRGGGSSGKTGVAVAMEMLPTLYLLDWMRSHWSKTISGRAGINVVLGTIWYRQAKAGLGHLVGSIPAPRVLQARQRTRFRDMVPRDRMARIQEVTQLAANNVLPPRELIRRLGDIEDVDETLGELWQSLIWQAVWDSAVAGHSINIRSNAKQPDMPLPEVQQDEQPKPKQPPTEPQQIAAKASKESTK